MNENKIKVTISLSKIFLIALIKMLDCKVYLGAHISQSSIWTIKIELLSICLNIVMKYKRALPLPWSYVLGK